MADERGISKDRSVLFRQFPASAFAVGLLFFHSRFLARSLGWAPSHEDYDTLSGCWRPTGRMGIPPAVEWAAGGEARTSKPSAGRGVPPVAATAPQLPQPLSHRPVVVTDTDQQATTLRHRRLHLHDSFVRLLHPVVRPLYRCQSRQARGTFLWGCRPPHVLASSGDAFPCKRSPVLCQVLSWVLPPRSTFAST